MPLTLSDSSVIVTGGARGIGSAVVDRFARVGARVAIGDLDVDPATEVADRYSDRVAAARLDVTDADSWREFLAELAHLGPFDILVNNAGIMPLGSFLKEADGVTRAIFDVNVHGPINGAKAVGPGMVDRGRGHIINVASAVGRVAVPDAVSYSASKHAVVGFSEGLRQELEPQGVDVTVILPTVVRTELAEGIEPARGIKPVTADEVAEVIEGAVRDPKPEIWVPKWSQALSKTTQALPRVVQNAMARATKADQLLAGADEAARQAYEQRARRGATEAG